MTAFGIDQRSPWLRPELLASISTTLPGGKLEHAVWRVAKESDRSL